MAVNLATALRRARDLARREPTRTLCPRCLQPVLLADVHGELVMAEVYEWQPRSRCFPCAGAQATSKNGRVHCSRCGGSGFIGERRPRERMLAIDMAWADDPHIRLIGPETTRKRGEGLHKLHTCPIESLYSGLPEHRSKGAGHVRTDARAGGHHCPPGP